MSTIVCVTDRAGLDQRTDNLVMVDATRERLLWIPRDLWCVILHDRINAAFHTGGDALLHAALHEHDLHADHSLLLSRAATEAALASAAVLVPVPAPMAFDYPLTPTSRIEDGRKRISFTPPAEVLRGERIHQWLGARGSDLHRIERQKVFVRRLLEQRFDFRRLLDNADWFRASSPQALSELSAVQAGWTFETFGPFEPVTIDGKQVLRRGESAAGVAT